MAMPPDSVRYIIPVEHAILGLLLGLMIYASEGSVAVAVVIGVIGALLFWTIDEDQKAHRDPDEEPSPGARDVLRERFWPPALATALRQLDGRRRLGAIVFHFLAAPLILFPFALVALENGDGVRAWIGAALVIVVVVELIVLAVALVILASSDEAVTMSPPEGPGL